EISEKTDLLVEYRKIKEGRRYTKIQFYIKLKAQGDKEYTRRQVESAKLWMKIGVERDKYRDKLDKLMEMVRSYNRKGISENQLLFIFINSKEDANMTYTFIERAIKSKHIENPIGFLIDALGIDLHTAKYKELIQTNYMFDEKMKEDSLLEEIYNGDREIVREILKETLRVMEKKAEEDSKIRNAIRNSKAVINILMNSAGYSEKSNKIYIVVEEVLFKNFFEVYIKDSFLEVAREKINENVDVEFIVLKKRI
ncbi:MAG: hypothetical protein ABDI07_11290, partial [Candidatus Kryptonium sp.]